MVRCVSILSLYTPDGIHKCNAMYDLDRFRISMASGMHQKLIYEAICWVLRVRHWVNPYCDHWILAVLGSNCSARKCALEVRKGCLSWRECTESSRSSRLRLKQRNFCWVLDLNLFLLRSWLFIQIDCLFVLVGSSLSVTGIAGLGSLFDFSVVSSALIF